MAGNETIHNSESKENLGEKNQLNAQSYPWLLIQDSINYRQRMLFYSISNKKYYKNTIPEMRNKKTCLSFYGWLILQDDKFKGFFLFSPITLEEIQLPSLESESDACFLSSPPSDSNCHVLFFDCIDKHIIFYCRLGDTKFIKKELDYRVLTFAEFEGKLYCLYTSESDGALLGEISFEGSHFQLTPLTTKGLKIVHHECPYYYYDYLIECSGDLLLVHKEVFNRCYYEIIFRMCGFKFDFLNKEWMEVKDIGQYAIFVSSHVGMASKATELGVKPNSIYIASSGDRRLRVYNINNGRISTTVPCPTASPNSQLHWFIPETNKLSHHSKQDSSFN